MAVRFTERGTKLKMDKKSLTLWIVIGILALLVIYVVFFKDASTAGNAVAATGRAATSAASSGGMVGGC